MASQSRASASGSVLVSQVLGAAELMGHEGIVVPELPTAKIAAKDPLRAAILTWIATTGAVVPADELARELARADAMPIELQRDIALLLLAASEATLMQRAALARLSPDEIAWIYAHPEVGELMSQGVESRETSYMAFLAAKVDMPQTIAASALLLEAVEATRGSLSKAEASQTVSTLAAGDLDATTAQVLQLLAGADPGASDREKVLLAARLVSTTGGFDLPALPVAPSFAAALDELLAQTGQSPDAAALAEVNDRASLLPADLQAALARLILAEALAVKASNPAHVTPSSQSEALASMLVATAEALPVLEKYGMYWSAAPEALRVGEWDTSARVGWVAHHAGLFLTARDDITTLASVAPLLTGHELATASVPRRSFTDAFLAFAKEGDFRVNESMMQELRAAEAGLDPAVRDAAALLLSGSAESARLQRLAFAGLSADEQAFLRHGTAGLDAVYSSSSPSDADLDRLARATQLSARVDADKLGQAALVAAMATADAIEMLEGRDAFATQSAVAHVATGLRGFFARFLPLRDAQAQPQPLCNPPAGVGIVESCPGRDDTLLRIRYPVELFGGRTPAEDRALTMMNSFGGEFYTCDARECVTYPRAGIGSFTLFNPGGRGYANQDILVITGTEGQTYRPALEDRRVCTAVPMSNGMPMPSMNCRMDTTYRYGSANIHIDLGGDDVWQLPVAVVATNATVPVAIHVDLGGQDRYADPSPLYDRLNPQLSDLGASAGHPTQASALYGGVAVLVDAAGSDTYDAPSRSQGFARLGFALLADLGAESDLYEAAEWGQGAAAETFNLGAAILFDRSGNDEYVAATGQGYGLASVLLDTGGDDSYRNDDPAMGVPVVRLDILPGGDVGSFDERVNNRVWIDGPGSINVGLGIDQEAILSFGQSDSDAYPDIVEFLVGTDPDDPASSPQSQPLGRAAALTEDGDGDGYPAYIERAFSTDPADGASYPAGFPTGVAVRVPSDVVALIPDNVRRALGIEGNEIAPFGGATTGSNFTSSDKIVDLRLPLQNAGTIDYACTGQFYPNATAPYGLTPGDNVFTANLFSTLPAPTSAELFDNPVWPDVSEDPNSGGPATQSDGSPYQTCLYVSYATSSPGNGNATMPQTDQGSVSASETRGEQFTFQLPAGILAIGDVVNTSYADDYFVVIDLGGPDFFNNSAGGALIVRTRPVLAEGQEDTDDGARRVTNTFLAPSLVVNVDTRDAADVVLVDSASDLYTNASRDFVHGAYYGVLVDNAGNDTYLAHDASQGALGGVLLDLAGVDSYRAGNLSQGASLASSSLGSKGDDPERPISDLPASGNVPADSVGSTRTDSFSGSLSAHRRVVPGILLDTGDFPEAIDVVQTFVAASHSQGFARGYNDQYDGLDNAAESSPTAFGILASLGGPGREVFDAKSRYAQGVGGTSGVGLLLNSQGSDTYLASGLTSQGATISQRVATGEAEPNNIPQPALGILADLAGADVYRAVDTVFKLGGSRAERSNNLTIQRSATWSDSAQNGGMYANADLGIHLDTDARNPNALLSGVVGHGASEVVSPTGTPSGFHVFMPGARLAIGSAAATTYSKEFAFVVDLGGRNTYNHNAGGFVRDVVASLPAGSPTSPTVDGSSVYGLQAGLFPVTLVVDGGRGDSTYASRGSFTQGSGFFGIGVLADLGGNDTIVAQPATGPSMRSQYLGKAPIIDGNVGSDWDGIVATPISLRSLDDERYETINGSWEIRVANDHESIFLAIKGRTTSEDEASRLRDRLNITFDMGRQQTPWNTSVGRTGVDQIRFYFENGKCVAEDWGVGSDGKYVPDVADLLRTRLPTGTYACRFTEQGEVFFEVRKPLVVQATPDARDLGYCYDDTSAQWGFSTATACVVPTSELGLYLQFADAGAGFHEGRTANFTWPAGAADDDGEGGHAKSGTIADEMRSWMAVGLAQNAQDGVVPNNVIAASLSQGVGLSGVGVVAMLGTSSSNTRYTAGDLSQGYATFGGLGLLLDGSGDDTYVAGKRTLGASEKFGFGLFIDTIGHDVYRPQRSALGWTVGDASGADGGQSVFLDLGGDDSYAWLPANPIKIDQARGVNQGSDVQLAPEGNNIMWSQGGRGAGFDYRVDDLVRQTVAAVTLDALYGKDGNNTRVVFDVTTYDPANPNGGPWRNGCTDRSFSTQPGRTQGEGPFTDYRVNGKVCFVATVDVSNSPAYNDENVRPIAESSPDPVNDILTGQTQNFVVGGRLNVSGVDFLLDRARVASTIARLNVTEQITKWAAPVDLTDAPDGVARAKALPLYAAELEQGFGTFLFYDPVPDEWNETDATRGVRTLLIDNPARPSIRLNCRPAGGPDSCAPPEYSGVANATYSAYGVGLGQKLFVNYTVDHDVGEDVYAQSNGWRPARTNMSYPCRGLPAASSTPQLCNTLPFYLAGDNERLTTTPGTAAAATKYYPEREGQLSYDAQTHELETDLRILDNESFRLVIPNRRTLDVLNEQATEVKVKLYYGNQEVLWSTNCPANQPTCPWPLGYIVDTAPQVHPINETTATAGAGCPPEVPTGCGNLPVGGGALGVIYNAVSSQINGYVATAAGLVGRSGTPLRLITDTYYGASAVGCGTGGWGNPPCRILTGRPYTSGQAAICETPGTATNAIAAQARAVDSLGQSSPAQHGVFCWNYYERDINTTADAGDLLLGGPAGAAGAIASSTLETVNNSARDVASIELDPKKPRVDGINFTDIRFDVTDITRSPPTSGGCIDPAVPATCLRVDPDGTFVVPKGYRIGLEFSLLATATCAQDACNTVGRNIRTARFGVLDGVNATGDATCEASCVNVYRPLTPLAPSFETTGAVNNSLTFWEDGEQLRRYVGGAAVPASVFGVKAGAVHLQPRLEVRVPAQPTTTTTVTIDDASGNPITTLRPGTKIVGDLSGTPTRGTSNLAARSNPSYWQYAGEWPHVNWTIDPAFPRWTQQSVVYNTEDLESGLYHVSVRANDGRTGEVVKREPVLIDHIAPATFVSSDSFAGKTTLQGSSIPIKWSVFEQGSGLKEVWVYTRAGAQGDLTQGWLPAKQYNANVRSDVIAKTPGVNEYLVLTVGVDRANNVEAAPSTSETPYATIDQARQAAFLAKVALGEGAGYRRVVVDEGNPRYTRIDLVGGREQNYLGDEFTFVRAGAPVRFEICALDIESHVQQVNLSLDRFDPLARSLINATFTMRKEGACGVGGTLFVHDSWHEVNTDATRFPEGVWVAQLEIFDAANNRIRVRPEGAAGNVILDHRSPEVTLESPVLPTGQSAVKPGDVVKIRVVATDEFGVDEGGIRVDASKFAKNASALRTKSVRVNGIIYQEAQFTVDLPTIQNGVFPVVVTVPDLAGNVTTVQTSIAVNFKPFEFVPGTLRVTNVTHNSATLQWQTDEPTSALAKFGTTSVALTGRTPQDLDLTRNHTLVVTGLAPSTHYFLRAVSVSAGGFTKESEIVEIDTTSALFLAPISPVTGDRVSGLVSVKFRGGLLDSTDFVSYTLEVRDSASESKPWTFLTTATRQGDEHELTWNSTRFLDGTAYQLRLSAAVGSGAAADRASIVISSLTSDNTPPGVLVLSPLLATNDTTPQLVAEASDGLAGLASGPVQLLIDGVAVPGGVTVEQLPAGRVRLSYNFTQPLAQGMRTFELRVPDRAGNVAKEIWRVAIDGDAPTIKIESTRYSPGTAAAKKGGTVTLNITTCDISGASSANADVRELRAATPELRLTRIVPTGAAKECTLLSATPAEKAPGWTYVTGIGGVFAYRAVPTPGALASDAGGLKGIHGEWQGTFTVSASDASGVKAVPVRVVDLAGNERDVVIEVPIDNVAPDLGSRSLAEIKHRRVAIEVPANEPILLDGTATAPASPPVTAATATASASGRLVFDGLLPSRTYQYKITAMDRAGNAVDLAGEFATLQDTVAPSAVGPLSVLDLLNGTLRLTWTPATDDVLVSHYRVYRSDDGITFRVVAEAPTASYDDGGLPYEKTYVYKVAAVDFGANEGDASPALRAAATAVPHLTVGAVTPTVGTTSTTFRYAVTYTSPGGVSPAYVRIILDGVPQNMTLESGTAKTGAVYVYETRLAPHKRDAPHTYSFEASDGRYTVTFPDGADVLRGPLVSGAGAGDEAAAGLGAFAQRVPLGGVGVVAIALVLAVALAAVLRRKKEGSK